MNLNLEFNFSVSLSEHQYLARMDFIYHRKVNFKKSLQYNKINLFDFNEFRKCFAAGAAGHENV